MSHGQADPLNGRGTLWVALLLMMAAFLPALVWRLQAGNDADLIITPLFERRVLALAILTPMVPACALMVAALRRTLRLWIVMALVFLILLGVIGGAALMTVLTDNWIFPDKLVRIEHTEPEELFIYDSSFLGCTVRVFAAKPGAVYARKVLNESIDCDRLKTVGARWKGNEVELVDRP